MVARVSLHEMRQDHDEPIRSFGARIRGQATVCKLLLNCSAYNTEVNYTDQILRDVLIRGIADHDIQLDILGDSNQDMSLEDTFRLIEAKESSQVVESARSHYKKSKEEPTQKNITCSYCGKTSHGRFAPLEKRKTTCSAFNKKCQHCDRLHHTEEMCRTKLKSGDHESAIFNNLCSASTVPDSINLDHHTRLADPYNDINDCWVRQSSKSQPFTTAVKL